MLSRRTDGKGSDVQIQDLALFKADYRVHPKLTVSRTPY